MAKIGAFTPDYCRRIMRVVRKVEGLRGPGVVNSPSGIAIYQPPAATQLTQRSPRTHFTARITSATQVGSNYQWAYGFSELQKTGAGYGGYIVRDGGITGTAYNRIEDQNAASGQFGNGVHSSNLTGTYEVQPVPTNTPVEMTIIKLPDGTTEYWFSYENGIDGDC